MLSLTNFRSFKLNLPQLPGPLADSAQQPDRTWARTGEYITLVSKDSALLGLPQAVEERVAAGRSLHDGEVQQPEQPRLLQNARFLVQI